VACIFIYTYVLFSVFINSCSTFQNSLHGNQTRNISSCSNCSLTQKVYVGSCTLGWQANFSFVIRTPHEVSSLTSLKSMCPTAGRITTNRYFPTRFCARTHCLYISWWTWQMDWLRWNNTLAPTPPVKQALDFCLCVKYSVCRTSVDDTANLRTSTSTSTIDAIRSAAKKMLTYAGAELAYRRDVWSQDFQLHTKYPLLSFFKRGSSGYKHKPYFGIACTETVKVYCYFI
jgi:hypothetical protein